MLSIRHHRPPPTVISWSTLMDPALVISRLESFEGRVPYLYLCTGGDVTVGIGHAIQTPADALQLTFSIAGRSAMAAEIQGDYASVAAAQKGLIAKAYAPLTTCRMADSDIDALVSSDGQNFETRLAARTQHCSVY